MTQLGQQDTVDLKSLTVHDATEDCSFAFEKMETPGSDVKLANLSVSTATSRLTLRENLLRDCCALAVANGLGETGIATAVMIAIADVTDLKIFRH